MPSLKFPFNPTWNRQLPYNPWVYFLLFFASNTFLSFGSSALSTKLWIGLLGLLLPLIVGLHSIMVERGRPKSEALPLLDEGENSIPPWLWILFLFSMVFTRFYHLTSLPFWPIGDEGIFSSLTLGLIRHWRWDLLEAEIRTESLFTWLSALFFRVVPPSLFSLRLLPALICMATTAGAYWAARSLFSKRTAFIFTWLMGLSFWEMTLSRFFMAIILVPLLQCLCLGGLGFFLKANRVPSRWKYFIFTLLMASLGFYACTSWPVIWLSVALILGAESYFRDEKKKKFFRLFLGLTPLLIFPLVQARFFEGEGWNPSGFLLTGPFGNRPLLTEPLCSGMAGIPFPLDRIGGVC